MFRNIAMLAAAAMLTLSASGVAAPPAVEELVAARNGDATIFRVRFAAPDDFLPATDRFSRRPNAAFLMPHLSSDPVWDVPCCIALVRNWRFGGEGVSLTFWGKAARTGAVKLTLQYPAKDSKWVTVPVELDLSKAGTLNDVPAEGPTPGKMLNPAQQFAQAQAAWFDFLHTNEPYPAGFWQYARLRTNAMAGLPKETRDDTFFAGDRMRADMMAYDTFTGSLAIQESLQLDRALRGPAGTTSPRTVDVSKIDGITVKPHPYDEMRKGREPKIQALARLAPADQYFLQFRSVAKLQELGDFFDQWGRSALEPLGEGSPGSVIRDRTQKQLCLPATLLSRTLGPALVKDVAITGSDPFFREGTDITVIFDLAAPPLFRTAVDEYWKAAQKAGAGASAVQKNGLRIESLVSPGREVSAFRVFDGSLAVYSNSMPALLRVFDAKKDPARSLAESPDFKYMRTEAPYDPEKEDGYLFLSDAFVRRLNGPVVRIAERRRLEALTAMRSVTNAVLLDGYLNGPRPVPPSLDELLKRGVLGQESLAIAGGEEIRWDPGKRMVSGTVHGSPGFLTPICEIPVDRVTTEEETQYRQFRDRYQEYWRRFFDPIGIRMRVGRTIGFEVDIIPLIEGTVYTDLKRLTGDKAGTFDLNSVSTGTILRWQVRLDAEAREARQARSFVEGALGGNNKITDWFGNWVTVFLGDSANWPDLMDEFGGPEADESPRPKDGERLAKLFDSPLAVGVEVKNPFALAGFLVAVRSAVTNAAPGMLEWGQSDPVRGIPTVKVSPVRGSELERSAPPDVRAAMAKLALHYATIRGGWYLTTQRSVLEQLADAAETTPSSPRPVEYSGLFMALPGNMLKSGKLVERAGAWVSEQAEVAALRHAWLLERCGLNSGKEQDADGTAMAFLDRKLSWGGHSPPTSRRAVDDVSFEGRAGLRSSAVRRPSADSTETRLVKSLESVIAWVRFTEHGLNANLEIKRKGGGETAAERQ